MKEPPNELYKFYTWSNPYHRAILTLSRLSFPSPVRFNDPFDCDFPSSRTQVVQRIQTAGICSMSESKTNVLLWSHYASKHTGFCVCFDAPLLKSELRHTDGRKGSRIDQARLCRVTYKDRFPQQEANRPLLSFLTTKAKAWIYEDEWRLIFLHYHDVLCKVPPESIKKVYLGCRISSLDEMEIRASVERLNPNIEMHRAVRKPGVFELGFERL